MARWFVSTRQVYEVSYEVEADSAEEAVERVYSDDLPEEEKSFDCFLKDETTVEEVEA